MIDQTMFGTVVDYGLHIVAAWTTIAFVIAFAWAIYRAPGREARLALETAREVAEWRASRGMTAQCTLPFRDVA